MQFSQSFSLFMQTLLTKPNKLVDRIQFVTAPLQFSRKETGTTGVESRDPGPRMTGGAGQQVWCRGTGVPRGGSAVLKEGLLP